MYLFSDADGRKYVLIVADQIGFYFDSFPHLLKSDNNEFAKLEFVLQREVPVKDSSLKEEAAGTILFEYR